MTAITSPENAGGEFISAAITTRSVSVYMYDGYKGMQILVPFKDFQLWASTVLAEISLEEKYR